MSNWGYISGLRRPRRRQNQRAHRDRGGPTHRQLARERRRPHHTGCPITAINGGGDGGDDDDVASSFPSVPAIRDADVRQGKTVSVVSFLVCKSPLVRVSTTTTAAAAAANRDSLSRLLRRFPMATAVARGRQHPHNATPPSSYTLLSTYASARGASARAGRTK